MTGDPIGTAEYYESYDDEEYEDDEREEDYLCIEEGGTGPCRHMACDEWGGDGLCFLHLRGYSRR